MHTGPSHRELFVRSTVLAARLSRMSAAGAVDLASIRRARRPGNGPLRSSIQITTQLPSLRTRHLSHRRRSQNIWFLVGTRTLTRRHTNTPSGASRSGAAVPRSDLRQDLVREFLDPCERNGCGDLDLGRVLQHHERVRDVLAASDR
jgi:hypothetical protein